MVRTYRKRQACQVFGGGRGGCGLGAMRRRARTISRTTLGSRQRTATLVVVPAVPASPLSGSRKLNDPWGQQGINYNFVINTLALRNLSK